MAGQSEDPPAAGDRSDQSIGAKSLVTRTYSWIALEGRRRPLSDMTGLAFVEGTRDGTVAPAPVAQTLGWQVEDVAEGKVTLHLDVAEHLMHGGGIVHGGVLSALLDSAMANAVLSTLAGGHGCTTLQMNVNFVRSVGRQSRWLRCEGRARHVGRRTANAEAQLADDQGHLCATASSVYLLVAPPADKA